MRLQASIQYISRFLEPTRVFIALMLAVGMWLFPFISFKEKTITPIEHGEIVSAVPFTAGAIGECSNVRCDPGYCCQFGYCVIRNKADCGQDDPPPPSPPTISANLNCSDWGDNGWCKGSLSIDLSAADPQGQSVVISGAVNGNNFACPSGATSCSIPLSGEGTSSVSYQVNSATGLSAAGSLGYQIDLTSPDLDTSVSGAGGTNGWYRSDVTLGVSASDATSGIASITASINGGGATSVGGSLTFSDGEYSVLIVARDNAGHVTQDTQIIKVDTITPSLSFTSSGTNGKNGWYVSSASATATAGDSGSGLASIEASVDGGGWTVSDSISLGDGVHTYQFRATDVAGNVTQTPTQTALVDTIAPSISMSQGMSLGEKVLYEIEDYGSGLSIFRAVIEDDDEAYQKVVWSGDISGSYIADDILWDGKFADGTKAGIGEYMVTLKITDAAGNKAIKATFVTVGLLDLLDDIPAFSPPVSSTSEEEDEIPTTASTTGPQTFGGIPTTTNAGEFISTTTTVSGITIPTTNIPLDPNILWGAAATAMVGATLADWQRQREEEARRRAAERAEEDRRANTEKRKAQKAAETAVRERWQEDARQERANNASTARWEGLAKQEEAKQQAKINDANAARWAGLAAMEQEKKKVSLGGGKPIAMPVQEDPPPPEPKSVWETIKDLWENLWNISDKQPSPTPDMVGTVAANIMKTMVAQTQTAMPTLTNTPTLQPTLLPTFTPTPPVPSLYIIDNGVRFRSEPFVNDSNIINKLQCGTEAQIIQGQGIKKDGKNIWHPVVVNGTSGWIAEEYLDEDRPICSNFAAKYATYPGAGTNIQINRLPFEYPNPTSLPSWWGYGNTTFARDHKKEYYLRTTGMHPGVDWGLPDGTKLIWAGNQNGIVINKSSYTYMSDPNHIVIESNGFHFIYGHTSETTVTEGQIVKPGEIIGYSGTPPNGDPHLHFEIRPTPFNNQKSSIVINPLTFFAEPLQTEWANLFNGDYYLPGDDALSLGYYTNTVVNP